MAKKNKKYSIIIFGPQGSGKGTQAQMIAKKLQIPHISTGVIFRQIKKENSNSAIGQKIAKILDLGNLIPDNLTNKLISERLNKPDCQRGFILDGYPRNKTQFDYLKKNIKINYIIVIDLPVQVGIQRIAGRRVCKNGHSYHLKFKPPKTDGICDIDGLPLFARTDETPKALKKRLEIYQKQTKPLIKKYQKLNSKIIHINGLPPIKQVSKEIKAKMKI